MPSAKYNVGTQSQGVLPLLIFHLTYVGTGIIMAEDLRAVVSAGRHHRRAYLAEAHTVAPSAPVEYAFIPLPLHFEGGTLEAGGTEGLADGKFLAEHPAAVAVLYLQLVNPAGRAAFQGLQIFDSPAEALCPAEEIAGGKIVIVQNLFEQLLIIGITTYLQGGDAQEEASGGLI